MREICVSGSNNRDVETERRRDYLGTAKLSHLATFWHRTRAPTSARLIRGSDSEELLPTEVQIRPVIGGVVAVVIPVSVV